ncbi:MAG: nucleoside-diphosphate sugar epimerase/dehydratase [Isosphaeraceae bacterium]
MSATDVRVVTSLDPTPTLGDPARSWISGASRRLSSAAGLWSPTVRARTLQLVGLQAVVLSVVYLLSYEVRFDGTVPLHYHSVALRTLPLVLALQIGSCFLLGAHRGLWRCAGFVELIQLSEAIALSSMLLFAANLWLLGSPVPRSVVLIDGILAVLVLGVLRGGSRLVRERYYPLLAGGSQERVLVLSASPASEALVREIHRQPWLGIRVAGIVDPNPRLHGCTLAGIRVLGDPSKLAPIVARHRVGSVLVPTPAVSSAQLRVLIGESAAAKVKVQVVPAFDALLNGTVTIQPRDVNVEDLLHREPVHLDGESIGQVLRDRVVLVTGAAGSIGSELCRQVLRYRPRRLVLLDLSENGLFYAEKALRERSGGTEIVTCLTSVADESQLGACMARTSPEVVFHAAAHKHVPMMEACPGEAIKNNVFGTRVLVDVAIRAGVKVLVMISTDKAVHPVSVMGASKRLAEMYVQSLGEESLTRLVTVRFGNVLGSNGSVVPLFQEQIRRGGPVTVTHPEMTRYFMTIPEAAQLVLQAGALGRSGEILVLDMGQAVRILDLARDLIHLSGMEPGRDIEIVFTGLRPGEKLHEELYDRAEEPLPTRHPKIKVARHRRCGRGEVLAIIEELGRVVDGSPEAVIARLEELLPEYRSSRSSRSEPAAAAGDPLPNLGPLKVLDTPGEGTSHDATRAALYSAPLP